MDKHIGLVYESSASGVLVKLDFQDFEGNKEHLKIGKHLKIEIGTHDFLIASINNIKAVDDGDKDKYFILAEPLGTIIDNKFYPGNSTLPSPTEKAYIADATTLGHIFLKNDKYSFKLGNLVQNKDINLHIDGNMFFSKHIAIVGSTGSGKSCAVSKILQEAVGIKEGKNENLDCQKNSHVIIFDIHSEYKAAFSIASNQNFTLNNLDVEKLKLPYWLMNSEELEALFIESNENNSHNQISQFRKAVILNKEKYNPTLKKITYDTPVYFSIEEVYNFISNLNDEVINKIPNQEQLPKVQISKDKVELINDINMYFETRYSFVPPTTRKEEKASNGSFNGEFNRFLSRLDNKINDKRLEFLMKPLKVDGSAFVTDDFSDILQQFLGYLTKSNVTIIDLSGIPFEVLSITVSLISRLIFDFAFHYSKLLHEQNRTNDVPFLLVCEEAHNYVPRDNSANYRASRKSIERIAKEGRKYGLGLMVVSQRPSEVSETIFAQCNNFISLRLTNSADQNYIKNLLPNNAGAIADILPTLSPGECLVVGEATPIPAVINLPMPNPEPKSENVRVYDIWHEDWKSIDKSVGTEINIDKVISRWKKE
ncbi:MAG: ATP-binding protein [Epulopiscium sp.]|nr:ATP-binding protein [Candidatus Epulonipiscium sp.]